VHFLDADGLHGKDLTEIDFLPAQTDTSTTGDHVGFIVQGIVDIRQSTVGTRGRLVDLRRTLHVQSFVGTFVVKDLDKFFEARLLLKKISGGRLGGLFLQGQMHALMTPVLLRMAGLDALNTDPQAEPPHRELAQVEQRMCGSERHTVIAADVGGQAALFKKPPLPNTPSKASFPPLYGEKVSPMCPVQCVTYVSGRSHH
jgi:hypothetical protein